MKTKFPAIVFFFLLFSTSAMADFVDNGDGTVTDKTTGLMWQQDTAGLVNWKSALDYCESLSLGGHGDWRLPDINELKSIVDATRYAPSIDTGFFSDTKSDPYWSSTTYTPDPVLAWGVDFYTGTSGDQPDKSETLYVRAVRGGGALVREPAFTGELTVDLSSGLAPATIQFQTFIAQGSPPFTYEYDFGDGNSVTGADKVAHTYEQPGTYTATVKVTDAAGAVIESRKTIRVTEPSRITDLTQILNTGADEMTRADDGETMGNVLEDAQNTILDTLEPIRNAEDDFKADVEASVQSGAEDLVSNTITRLNTLIQEGKVTDRDLGDISSGLGEVTSRMVKNSVPVTDRTRKDLQSVSGTVYTRTLDTILQNENLSEDRIDTLKTDKAEAQNFYRNKPYLLDDISDQTGILVDTTMDLSSEKITEQAAKHQLSDVETGKLFAAVRPTPDIDRVISETPGVSSKTIARLVEEIYRTHYGKTVAKVTMDDIARNLVLNFADGTTVSVMVKSLRIVEEYLPQGLFDLPDGNKLGVMDGHAMEFTSYPLATHTLASDIIKLGIDPVIFPDGGIRIGVDSSNSLSLRSGWDSSGANTFESLTTSFSVRGGDNPAAEAFALMATYDTGFRQMLPPAIMAIQALTDALDAVVPGVYRIDPNTGVLLLGSLKLKPDYLFTATAKIDHTAIEGSGGFIYLGLGFEIADVNHDGITDILLHSENPMGRQVLYGLAP